MALDLPGGLDESEIDALRRLQRELASSGYRVVKVGLAAGGRPAAMVYAGEERDPVDLMLISARSVLRLAGKIPLEFSVDAEEYETLTALRVTAVRLAKNAGVEQGGKYTAGDVARLDLVRHVHRGMDLED